MLVEFPLQIYDAGLTFSPTNSLVRKAFIKEQPSWVTMKIHPEPEWPAFITGFFVGGRTANIRCCIGSTDGKWIATCWADYIEVWDAIRGVLVHVYHFQDYSGDRPRWSYTGGLAFSEDNSRLYVITFHPLETGSMTWKVLSWDLDTNEFQQNLSFVAEVWDLSLNACYVASITAEGDGSTIQLHDIKRGMRVTCTIDGERVESPEDGLIAFANDNSAVSVWKKTGWFHVWLTKGMNCVCTIQGTKFYSCRALALSSLGRLLAVAGRFDQFSSMVQVYHVQTGTLLWSKEYICHQLIFLYHGPHIAMGEAGSLKVLHEESGEVLNTESIPHIKRIATCGQLIVVVEDPNMRYFIGLYEPYSLLKRNGSTRDVGYFLRDQHLSLVIQNKESMADHNGYYFQQRCIDSGKLLYQSPKLKHRPIVWLDKERCFLAVNSTDHLTIWTIHENELVRHSVWEVSHGQFYGFPFFAPNGVRIAIPLEDQTIIIDLDQRSMTSNHVPCSEPQGEWLDNGRLFFRKASEGSILWSLEKGFIHIHLHPEFLWTSTWGTWLANKKNKSSLFHQGSKDVPLKSRIYDCIEIWDMAVVKLRSVINIDGSVKQVTVLPDIDKLLIATLHPYQSRQVSLWTTSGTLETSVQLDEYFHMVHPLTDSLLQTERGVLSIDCGIRFGSEQDVYRAKDWFYRDGKKVLWIPPSYHYFPYNTFGGQKSSVYSDGMSMFKHASDKVTVLKFSFQ